MDIPDDFNVWYFIHSLLLFPFLVLLIRNVLHLLYRGTGIRIEISSSSGVS